MRFIFQSGRRLSGFFSFKNRIPKSMRSRIICKHSCQYCRALYFGLTRRHFHTRISQHMGVSPLTGKKLATNSLSSVLAHSHQSLHHISPDDFTIISSCRSNSNFELLRERAYLYRNLDPLSTKTSHPYPFLYFSFTRPPFHCAFHFILFYLYFLVTLHLVTLILLFSSHVTYHHV